MSHILVLIQIVIFFYIIIGLHPRLITDGYDLACTKALEVLESVKIPIEIKRENLLDVARTSLKTKV
jgi:T-complex protein 1 subunit zeta